MSATTSSVHDIRFVVEAAPADGGLRIAFRDGTTAFLDRSHRLYKFLRIDAESNRGRFEPVGVVLTSDGVVVDLNSAHETTVRWVREFPGESDRFELVFWAYSPVCGLTRDQPDFERLHATLAEAAMNARPLWVVVHTDETVDEEPDEEGCAGMLPRLMDVRPVASEMEAGRPAPESINGTGESHPHTPCPTRPLAEPV